MRENSKAEQNENVFFDVLLVLGIYRFILGLPGLRWGIFFADR